MDYPHAKEWPKDQSLKFLCRAASKCFLWTTYWLCNYEYRCFRQRKNYYFFYLFIFLLILFCIVSVTCNFQERVKERKGKWENMAKCGMKRTSGEIFYVRKRRHPLSVVSIFPLITEASQKSKCKPTPTTYTHTVWSCTTINEFCFKICLELKANP